MSRISLSPAGLRRAARQIPAGLRRAAWSVVFGALVTLLLVPAAGRAEIITLGSARDNTLIQVPSADVEQRSNGGGPNFFVGRNNSPDGSYRRRGLVMFDLAGQIPEGAVITSVSLTLDLTQGGGTNTDVIQLHRMLRDWGEGASFSPGGQGSPAMPPDATWFFNRFDGSLWSTPGGDFAALGSASTVVSTNGQYTWASTPALLADVLAWLADPSSNFGWLLQGGETEAGNVHGFATRETGSGFSPPRLTIEYNIPVPEPASVTLLGLGALCLIGYARRRRCRV